MSPETRIKLALLERELTEATRPIVSDIPRGATPRRIVRGWPRVSHPGIVRRWLGDDAVVGEDHETCPHDGEGEEYVGPVCDGVVCRRWPDDCIGTLSDPEACGHVLAHVRQLLATGAMLGIDGSDTVVAEYAGRIFARVAG